MNFRIVILALMATVSTHAFAGKVHVTTANTDFTVSCSDIDGGLSVADCQAWCAALDQKKKASCEYIDGVLHISGDFWTLDQELGYEDALTNDFDYIGNIINELGETEFEALESYESE